MFYLAVLLTVGRSSEFGAVVVPIPRAGCGVIYAVHYATGKDLSVLSGLMPLGILESPEQLGTSPLQLARKRPAYSAMK